MSGQPNKEQIERVIKIGRTVNRLVAECEDIAGQITTLKKRVDQANSAFSRLRREREDLMRKMDVHFSQVGNVGHEARMEMFLSIMSSLPVVGVAEEPTK